MRLTTIAIAAFAALAAAPSAANAASEADMTACRDRSADKGVAACTRVIDDAGETPARRAVAYDNRGYIVLTADDDPARFDRAIADFNAAIRLDPRNANAVNDRGVAYEFMKDYDRALADYGKAIDLAGGDTWPYYNRGYVYFLKGEYDRALADYNEALAIDVFYASAYQGRGAVYEAKGDFAKATAEYNAAIRYAPAFAAPRGGIGSIRFKTGDYAGAIASYSEGLKLQPASAVLLKGRGIAGLYAGAYPAAANDLAQAAALAPADPYALVWLGIARNRNQDRDPARGGTGKVDLSAWPAPVLRAALGEMPPAALAALGGTPAEKCEAAFFAGAIALSAKDRDQAVALFRTAARDCPVANLARYAAAAELKAAGVAP